MKKSKLLLTLVVVFLMCSMLFALVACGGDEKEPQKPDTDKPAPEQPTEPEVDDTLRSELSAAVANAWNADSAKTVGVDYELAVDTADGKQTIIGLKMNLVPPTKDAEGKITKGSEGNMLQLTAKTTDTDGFKFIVDDENMYVLSTGGDSKPYNRNFPGFGFAAIMDSKVVEENAIVGTVKGLLPSLPGMIFDIAFPFGSETTKEGNVYTSTGDLSALGDMINELVGGMIPQIKYINIAQLLKDIKPSVKATVENGMVTKMDVTIDVSDIAGKDAKANLHFNKTVAGNTAVTGFEDLSKVVWNSTSSIINFNLHGNFFMDQKYTYAIDADIDVFCALRHIVANGTGNDKIANIFDESTTKFYAEVKDASNAVILAAAMDAKDADMGNIVYLMADTSKAIPAAFIDAIFPAEKAAAMKAPGMKVYTVDAKALITAKLPKAPAVATADAAVVAPVLTATEPTNDAYVAARHANPTAKVPGVVSWDKAEGVTYAVTVGGDVVEPTLKGTKYSVAATSGEVVEVTATKGTAKAVASKTYIDGRATAKAVAMAVSMLTAIDYDYTEYAVVVDSSKLLEFVKALDYATDINVKGMDLTKILSYFDLGEKIMINADGEYFGANVEGIKAKVVAASGLADMAAVKAAATPIK